MDSTIRVQKLNTKHRRTSSLSKDRKHRVSSFSSSSVSRINKSSLSHYDRSSAIQVRLFFFLLIREKVI